MIQLFRGQVKSPIGGVSTTFHLRQLDQQVTSALWLGMFMSLQFFGFSWKRCVFLCFSCIKSHRGVSLGLPIENRNRHGRQQPKDLVSQHLASRCSSDPVVVGSDICLYTRGQSDNEKYDLVWSVYLLYYRVLLQGEGVLDQKIEQRIQFSLLIYERCPMCTRMVCISNFDALQFA